MLLSLYNAMQKKSTGTDGRVKTVMNNIPNNNVLIKSNNPIKNNASFEQETQLDRLNRFNGIINMCIVDNSNGNLSNISRAIKVLEKLFLVRVIRLY